MRLSQPAARPALASRLLGAVVATLLLGGCNSGLIAAIVGTGGDSGTDSPTSIGTFAVDDRRASPATVRFRLTDADGEAARLELFYRVQGGAAERMTQLGGVSNPGSYAASGAGVEHTLSWDFAAEAGLPEDGALTPGVTVFALLEGGSTAIVPGANAAVADLGNDSPAIGAISTPSQEGSGIVLIEFELSDSSGDLVDVRVEYALADQPEDWHLARPAEQEATPEHAIVGLPAPAAGVEVAFFWDTGFDLPELERDVRLRFTPTDGTTEGGPVESPSFRVDNNEEPLVLLNEFTLSQNSDPGGGLAVPFTARDEEGNEVHVVFQWRRPGESFPALPAEPAELLDILSDPELRAQHQVCSERTNPVLGRPEPVDAVRLRLPELGTSAVPMASGELVGLHLELLRPEELAVELADGWPQNPLSGPVAAEPVGEGLEALVLDQPAPGSWRLARIELATGVLLEVLAQGAGLPTAFALDRGARVAFVASDLGSAWRVARIALDSGEQTGLVQAASLEPGGVRGLAVLSEQVAIATADQRLLRLDLSRDPAAILPLVSGLHEPWGVAADPLEQSVVLVAERGADRVIAVDLERRVIEAVLAHAAPDDPSSGLPAPRALALDRRGARLLVVVEPQAGQRQLRALNRRTTFDVTSDGRADPFAYSLVQLGPGGGTSVGTGSDGLRLIPDPLADGLLAIGGLEQRRTIVAASPADTVVTLDAALVPPLDGPRRWRIVRRLGAVRATPEGTPGVFPWDTRDVDQAGEVFLRATPFDSELGVETETVVPRAIASEIGARSTILPGTGGSGEVVSVVVDFDHDGDLDVAVADGVASRVYLQEARGSFSSHGMPLGPDLSGSLGASIAFADLDGDDRIELIHPTTKGLQVFRGSGPGSFDPVPVLLPYPAGATPRRSMDVEVFDLEGDGDLDVAFTTPAPGGGTPGIQRAAVHLLVVYRQEGLLNFGSEPLLLGGPGLTEGPQDILAADLDGDGDLDLATANDSRDFAGAAGVVVHFQIAPGEFDPQPLLIGGQGTDGPGGQTNTNAQALAAADLDGDGDLDLAVAHKRADGGGPGSPYPFYHDVVTIHLQGEPGVFGEPDLVLGGLGLPGDVRALAIADVEGDGDPDVVTQGSAGIAVFFQTAPGAYDPLPLVLPYESPGAPPGGNAGTMRALAVADLDGDGDLDFIYRDWTTNEVVVRLQTRGVEGFSPQPLVLGGPATTGGAGDLVVADLDGDGDLDVASANGGADGALGAQNTLSVFFQTAPRLFEPAPLVLGGPPGMEFPTSIGAADLDQDGDRDLFASSTATNELHIHFQVAPGVFDPEPTVLPGLPTSGLDFEGPSAAIARDLDGDGDLDLAALQLPLDQPFGYAQGPPGEFSSLFVLGAGYGPGDAAGASSLTAADLDGDGDLELAVAAARAGQKVGTVRIHAGSGPGQFDPEGTSFGGGGSTAILAADVDGDGDLDLVTTDASSSGGNAVTGLQIRLRNAQGGYDLVRVPVVPTGHVYYGNPDLRLADLDLDGDLDVALSLPNAVGIVEQLAPGVFAHSARESATPGSEPVGLFLADVDGDGELDALAPVRSSGSIEILWGNR